MYYAKGEKESGFYGGACAHGLTAQAGNRADYERGEPAIVIQYMREFAA